MKIALPRAARPSTMAMQLARMLVMIGILVALGFGLLQMTVPGTTTTAAPAQPAAPISAPAGNYRIPSEPIDYNDPNYIGSYGG
jgi:hypothetical protein